MVARHFGTAVESEITPVKTVAIFELTCTYSPARRRPSSGDRRGRERAAERSGDGPWGAALPDPWLTKRYSEHAGVVQWHHQEPPCQLKRDLASLRYDLEREVDDRRTAIRSVREDCAA